MRAVLFGLRGFAAWLPLLTMALLSCVCSRVKTDKDGSSVDPVALNAASTFAPDEGQVAADLAEMTRAPHPFGSLRQAQVQSWLLGRIAATGLTPVKESFSSAVPNPLAMDAQAGPVNATLSMDGANIYAFGALRPEAPCVVALASHYDTKVVAGIDYVGANDSGSSSVLLLQILAFLKAQAGKLDVTCDVIGIWFDGEESLLPGWSDGEKFHPAKIKDNTYGSRHGAGRLAPCSFDSVSARCLPTDLGGKPLVALILMDMIGSPDLLISREGHSTDALTEKAVQGAEGLGFKDRIAQSTTDIEDDHVPYLKAKVPALDLIDFNHLGYWHQSGDEASTLSMESLKIAGRIAIYAAAGAAREPKVFLSFAEE